MNKNPAFTIAELLITLAIIGIIAAMTIPSIVASHQKAELSTRFAKNYSVLMQAMGLAQAQNGPIESWDWKNSYNNDDKRKFVKTYFLPYVNVAKYCPDAFIIER